MLLYGNRNDSVVRFVYVNEEAGVESPRGRGGDVRAAYCVSLSVEERSLASYGK